jgi:hypothetical protein
VQHSLSFSSSTVAFKSEGPVPETRRKFTQSKRAWPAPCSPSLIQSHSAQGRIDDDAHPIDEIFAIAAQLRGAEDR